jgi:hypothetical protein
VFKYHRRTKQHINKTLRALITPRKKVGINLRYEMGISHQEPYTQDLLPYPDRGRKRMPKNLNKNKKASGVRIEIKITP